MSGFKKYRFKLDETSIHLLPKKITNLKRKKCFFLFTFVLHLNTGKNEHLWSLHTIFLCKRHTNEIYFHFNVSAYYYYTLLAMCKVTFNLLFVWYLFCSFLPWIYTLNPPNVYSRKANWNIIFFLLLPRNYNKTRITFRFPSAGFTLLYYSALFSPSSNWVVWFFGINYLKENCVQIKSGHTVTKWKCIAFHFISFSWWTKYGSSHS